MVRVPRHIKVGYSCSRNAFFLHFVIQRRKPIRQIKQGGFRGRVGRLIQEGINQDGQLQPSS